MEVLHDPAATCARARQWRRDGLTIGLVPTMGNLHEGHLSLLRAAAAACDRVVVSIFVNPLQFGPNEDFESYPRTFDDDRAAAETAGAGLIFAPTLETIYPPEFRTAVTVAELTEGLCGRSRPGHFDGVTTIVAKLFALILPDQAWFGEKDYQQLRVISVMNDDLGFGIELVPMPIVREPDGLALSSRNRYLSPEDRAAAPALSRALAAAQAAADDGGTAAETIESAARIVLARSRRVAIEYIELVDPVSLARLPELNRPGRLCLAAKLGQTRLIDNRAIVPPVIRLAEETR